MVLQAEIVTIVAVAAAGLAVLLLIALVVVAMRLRRLTRAYRAALDTARGEDVFEALQRQSSEIAQLRADVGVVHGNTERLRELVRGTLSKVAVVRYDAFEDMGGALSFTAALLDEHANGFVISAINGRSETRCYAKPVTRARSDYNLSREEVAAIESAMSGQKDAVLPPTGRRRRAS